MVMVLSTNFRRGEERTPYPTSHPRRITTLNLPRGNLLQGCFSRSVLRKRRYLPHLFTRVSSPPPFCLEYFPFGKLFRNRSTMDELHTYLDFEKYVFGAASRFITGPIHHTNSKEANKTRHTCLYRQYHRRFEPST